MSNFEGSHLCDVEDLAQSTTFWLYWILRISNLPKDIAKCIVSKSILWKLNPRQGNTLKIFKRFWVASGANDEGQFGNGSIQPKGIPRWTEVNPPVPFLQISSGWNHSLAISKNGSLWTWGKNEYGELGFGDKEPRISPSNTNFQHPVTHVQAGALHSTCITNLNTLFTCGNNENGRLGIDSTDRFSTTFIRVSIDNVLSIACGASHSLCLTQDNTVYSWGFNGNGQLGLGNQGTNYSPQKIPSLSDISSVHVCNHSSYAVNKNGEIYGWGRNQFAENQQLQFFSNPQLLTLPSKVLNVACGYFHVICLCENGKVYGWGQNDFGQLGCGKEELGQSTMEEAIIEGEVEKVMAIGRSSFFIMKGGVQVLGCGSHGSGQLGFETEARRIFVPVKLFAENIDIVATQNGNQALSTFFLIEP